MAIKVSGTEVISDSRALSNIASVDAATVTALSNAGVGGGATLQATASGTLANGDTVVVNADGTVSVVSGNFAGLTGTVNTVPNDPVLYAVDIRGSNLVVAYKGSSNYGTAVAGTISGTSITFGTAVVFWSQAVFDIDVKFISNDRFIVGWTGPYAQAMSGTISGTSITFGGNHYVHITQTDAAVKLGDIGFGRLGYAYRTNGNISYFSAVYPSGSTGVNSTDEVQFASSTNNADNYAIVPNTSESRGVLFYDGYQNRGSARSVYYTGTIGSEVVFNSNQCDNIKAVYDPVSQKNIVFYQDQTEGVPKLQFTTVSGASLSFGPEINFPDADLSAFKDVVYDSGAGKIVIFYDDKVMTATTTSSGGITFSPSSDVVTGTNGEKAVYDSSSEASLYFYDDSGLKAQFYELESSNFDSYLGISDGAYSDGAEATIQIVGSVDDAQTGLTAGQKYYVLADGSLGTTPSDTSEVYAGLAVSSTNLIVKG